MSPPVTARSAARSRRELEEYFARQPTPARLLPDPEPVVRVLAVRAIEVISGVRDIQQLARWLGEDAFAVLRRRASLAARARGLRGAVASRPLLRLGEPRMGAPRDGVVEAAVVVHSPGRARAVAVRLEGLDHRWRATALHVL